MISLCSGCVVYYLFDCKEPYEKKQKMRTCEKFKFYPTKHYRTFKQFKEIIQHLDS